MKKLIASALFGIAALTLSAGTASAAVEVGQPAPAATFTDTNGVAHSLTDFAGKIVVLEWTNHQCPFVVKHYSSGNMQKIQADATGKGVVWISVVSSAEGKEGFVSAEEANKITADQKAVPTAKVLDPKGDLGNLFGAKTTPHMFVIDQKGVVAYAGAIDDKASADTADIEGATNYVTAAYEALLAGKPVEVAATQAYGCSVKY